MQPTPPWQEVRLADIPVREVRATVGTWTIRMRSAYDPASDAFALHVYLSNPGAAKELKIHTPETHASVEAAFEEGYRRAIEELKRAGEES